MNVNAKKAALVAGVCLSAIVAGTPQAFAVSVDTYQTAQQAKTVTGTVVDESGIPIIGANILEKGTTNGVITDIDGNFSLNVSEGAVITVSYIGYVSQEITIGNQSALQITLKEDSETLDEVVVVGYGVQKKKLVTGATVQVKGDNIQKLNTTNALGALQSQTPGVNIVASSGQPGEGYRVNIRGAGTNGSTTPLYIIDGVEGDINTISPADIESVDVLKDAASAAIYGARAANGVILITTKQGKEGKMQVSYDGYVGWQDVYKMPDLLNAREYMEVMDRVNVAEGGQPYNWTDYMSQEQYDAYMNGSAPGTNWMEAIRNKGAITTSHSINLAGGSEYSKFSTGISYMKQEGTLGKPAASDYSRFTVRLNSEHVLWRKDDLDIITFGENFYYNHNQRSGIYTNGQSSNTLSEILRANPLIPVYNESGEYYGYDDLNNAGWFGYNPYSTNPIAKMTYIDHGNNISKNYSLNMVGYLKVQPIKGLTYKGQVSYRQSSNSYRRYNGIYHLNDISDQRTDDEVQQSMGTGWNWSVENTLNYTFDVKDEHHFDVLLGQSFQKSGFGMGEDISATASSTLFGNWEMAYLSNSTASTPRDATGAPWGDNALSSFFGRVNYDWKETYMASLIVRGDGSSNFARGHRWGTFPSASVGWVMTNEKWMQKSQNWLDFLKLRASWGQNGNCNIDNFYYVSMVAFDTYGRYPFGNNKDGATQGGYAVNLPNEEVTWETSEQWDFGIDARFLNGRLNFAFDYYIKNTKDLLVQAPILDSYGLDAPYVNGGDVRNKGFEIALGWNDQKGDFRYNVNLNLAHNKNEVTRINNRNGYIEGESNILSNGTAPIYRMQVGHPIGYFYGYKTEGVMQNAADVQAYLDKNCQGNAANSLQGSSIQPGDLKFVDVNGDGTITEADKTEIGNPHPDFTGGISFSASYKGWDLSFTTYGAFGQQNIRSWRQFMGNRYDNYSAEVLEYWNGEGTSNKYPRLTTGSNTNFAQISDIYVEDADYFRLQNLTLGYDLKNIWKKCPMQQLRLYVTAQNLFTITGYKGMDPEIGANAGVGDSWASGIDVGYYPAPRTYMVGVNIKF